MSEIFCTIDDFSLEVPKPFINPLPVDENLVIISSKFKSEIELLAAKAKIANGSGVAYQCALKRSCQSQ